ncbi:MAG: DUF952 domain-containing protein, partial [SAR324 cluster bacterium]|nr:DUF952 domain-containing protein [SAR324 cluster bacterium]
MEHLYHILSSNDWSEESTVDYLPQSFDEEGFIHLSTEQQLLDTANRHFRQERSLHVLEVNPSGLENNLIFEQIGEA